MISLLVKSANGFVGWAVCAAQHSSAKFVIVGCVCAPRAAAAGKTYLVSDGEDISTPGLLRRIGEAIGRPARLFPCPPALLKWAGALAGRSAKVERLMSSLQVDSGKIRRELNWTPPYTLQHGLQATAEWYRNALL